MTFIVAIDGAAGTGKGTIAKGISKEFNFSYFDTGIIYRAVGIPLNMFTVMFALGRIPGWIAQWKEMHNDPKQKITRPRQLYVGQNERKYIPITKRN